MTTIELKGKIAIFIRMMFLCKRKIIPIIESDFHLRPTKNKGYRECVEYISTEVLIATGPSGTDISLNEGKDLTTTLR